MNLQFNAADCSVGCNYIMNMKQCHEVSEKFPIMQRNVPLSIFPYPCSLSDNYVSFMYIWICQLCVFVCWVFYVFGVFMCIYVLVC